MWEKFAHLPTVFGLQLIVKSLSAVHQGLPSQLTGALLPYRLTTFMVLLLLLTTWRDGEREREIYSRSEVDNHQKGKVSLQQLPQAEMPTYKLPATNC